jgi:LEA14-like dessication related protein
MYRLLVCLALLAGGCHAAKSPELRVLGLNEASASQVVFVQVTNPESRPMRLTKLEYKFAAAGATVSHGEVPLGRDVPAGAAVVVEVPLELETHRPLVLTGKLVAELDQMVREFQISAQIQPH